MPQRRCITCGQLTTRRTRCARCQSQRDRVRNASRVHYAGAFDRLGRAVRDAANADPTTRCRTCGGLARPGDPWQAGHVIDGDPNSPLQAEHRSCNARGGAAQTNRRKGGGGSNP